MDTGVMAGENRAWLNMLRTVLDPEIFELFRSYFIAAHAVDMVANVGIVKGKLPWVGTISGGPDTKLANTWIMTSRLMSAPSFKLADGVIQWLDSICHCRPAKQHKLEYTATMCQKVVSARRPGCIHGLVARIIRGIVEYEDYPSEDTRAPEVEDARLISKLANLHSSPAFLRVVEWVLDHWDIRTPRKRILQLLDSMNGSVKPNGVLERQAIAAVLSCVKLRKIFA
jgi:hypothetical protein